LSAISEIIDGFQFNIADWGEEEEGSWDDDDDDDEIYIAQHHGTTDWPSNSHGWGWEDTNNDEECAVDWRNIY